MAAVDAYAARAELPGWRPGADGVPRVDYHEVPSALGIAHEQLMAEIHGRLPDGTWVSAGKKM